MLVFVVDAYLIVKDGVEANVAEVRYFLHCAEVVAIAFAQGEDGAAGAEHLLPEVGEGGGLGVGVDLDDLLRGGWEGKGEDQGKENEGRVAKSEHGYLSRERGW